jgi:hypothetical protein
VNFKHPIAELQFFGCFQSGCYVLPEAGLQMKITDHPFFGMSSQASKKSVLDEMADLRGADTMIIEL